MSKQLARTVLLGALALAAQATGAADVVTIADYGEDGNEHYYQVTCSDNARGSVVVQLTAHKTCAHPADGKTMCRASWSVREAAAHACR